MDDAADADGAADTDGVNDSTVESGAEEQPLSVEDEVAEILADAGIDDADDTDADDTDSEDTAR